MASGQKLLIDTNVLIGLEDWKVIPANFAKLNNLCSKYGCRLYVHEASLADIARDANDDRRKTTLSKLGKFERLSGIKVPPTLELIESFGKISNANDEADVALLYALDFGAVDFLVTQDQGIHARARRRSSELADRVLTVSEAVDWLIAENEPKAVNLPLIEERPAHAIDPRDDIFESLREGYEGFDLWWKQKCVAEHRPCWVLTIEGALAGIVVRKDEVTIEEGRSRKGLKLCTFKVKPEYRGEKLGELLLKQALWFAQKNQYDFVYLTTFPIQVELISVLEYYGFERSGPDGRGELTMFKSLSRERLSPGPAADLFDTDRLNYPRFVPPPRAGFFCVPIQGEYHEMLFPELAASRQLSLFLGSGLAAEARKPGNTIRKVYLCRASTNKLGRGSVILFYHSASKRSGLSQVATTIAVVERVSSVSDLEELVRLTAKRSVYSMRQLRQMFDGDSRPVKAVDFLLSGHLTPPLPLDELIAKGVLRGAPQSITQLDVGAFATITTNLDLGFTV